MAGSIQRGILKCTQIDGIKIEKRARRSLKNGSKRETYQNTRN
jgi:hypothetical protein